MDKNNPTVHKKLLLLAATCLLLLLPIFFGEIYCRLFTRINFLDNSRGMFEIGKYGKTYGNTPNFQGYSFGQKFVTDENGFRMDEIQPGQKNKAENTILIIGDSVTFGTGVPQNLTIAGILNSHVAPEYKIVNASAIGYDTYDYQNVVNSVIAQNSEIKKVLLFFCLNDVNDVSAQQIRRQINEARNPDQIAEKSTSQTINDFLRSRSKLYLWLKNALRDTQLIYFKNDFTQYQQGDDYISEALKPLSQMKTTLDVKGISLKVFVLPYEVQTRSNVLADYLLPQQKVDDYLKVNDIPFNDFTPNFQKQSSPNTLFLYGDPMHLSEQGNLLTANLVCADLKEVCKMN